MEKSDVEIYIDSMAAGYRFRPKDVELILYYLARKINNLPLPPNMIYVVNFYDFSPEILAERFRPLPRTNDWYFFTPRQRKYRKGSRPDRGAGDGYWKATGSDHPIQHNGLKVGNRKSLVFIRGKHSDDKKTKTDWKLTEFVVEKNGPSPLQTNGNNMKLDDWVLCKLHKSTEKQGGTKRKKTAGKDDDMDPITEEDETEMLDDIMDKEAIMNNNNAVQLELQDRYEHNPHLPNHVGADDPLAGKQVRNDHPRVPNYNLVGAHEPPAATWGCPQPLDAARSFYPAVDSNIPLDHQPGIILRDHSVPVVRHQPETTRVHSFNELFSVPPLYPVHTSLRSHLRNEDSATHYPLNHTMQTSPIFESRLMHDLHDYSADKINEYM